MSLQWHLLGRTQRSVCVSLSFHMVRFMNAMKISWCPFSWYDNICVWIGVCVCLRHVYVHVCRDLQVCVFLQNIFMLYFNNWCRDEPVVRGCCWCRGWQCWCVLSEPQSCPSILRSRDVPRTGSTQSFHPGSPLTSRAHSGARRWGAEAAVGGLCWAARMLLRKKHST